MFGRPLRIGRPADYKAPPPGLEHYIVGYPVGTKTFPPTNINAAAALAAVTGQTIAQLNPALADQASSLMSLTSPLLPSLPPMPLMTTAAAPPAETKTDAGPPSRVLLLRNMATAAELERDQDFQDILVDIREECERLGTVLQVLIPRPASATTGDSASATSKSSATDESSQEAYQDGDGGVRGDSSVGVGRVFVLFREVSDCAKAIAALGNRQFNEHTVLASFYDEKLFNDRKFSQ